MTTILNLGCGARTSPMAVNIDWSIYLRARRSRVGRLLAPLVLRGYRLKAFRRIDSNVLVHDLSKGIPVATETADAVYHSHVLEHLDREYVPAFSKRSSSAQAGRCASDRCTGLRSPFRGYVASLEARRPDHDEMISALIEHSVRREASGTSRQPAFRRCVGNLLLGDARKRGETHQWAWDRLNLQQVLESVGFVESAVMEAIQSRIPGWAETGLDTDSDGAIYKPGSLWAEAIKPLHRDN